MTDIVKLKGLGPVSLKRLNDAGVKTLQDLLVKGPKGISEITNGAIDLDKADEIIREAKTILLQDQSLAPKKRTGSEIAIARANLKRCTTGCKALDAMLSGGIEPGLSTEVYGEYGSGKSQLMHTLMVMAQLPIEQGGWNGQVLVIDTEKTFRPERIRQILLSRKLVPVKEQTKEQVKNNELPEPEDENDIKKFLDNIVVVEPINSGDQQYVLEYFSDYLKEQPNLKLMIIDSLTAFFRGEFLGRGNLSARQIGLTEHVKTLTMTNIVYENLAIVWTNQVMADPGQLFGDPTRPIGGHFVAHSSGCRIWLKKSGKKKVAKLMDSSLLEEAECLYTITRAGIVDYEEIK